MKVMDIIEEGKEAIINGWFEKYYKASEEYWFWKSYVDFVLDRKRHFLYIFSETLKCNFNPEEMRQEYFSFGEDFANIQTSLLDIKWLTSTFEISILEFVNGLELTLKDYLKIESVIGIYFYKVYSIIEEGYLKETEKIVTDSGLPKSEYNLYSVQFLSVNTNRLFNKSLVCFSELTKEEVKAHIMRKFKGIKKITKLQFIGKVSKLA